MIRKICANCKYYDFEAESMQECVNPNNYQYVNGYWYKMMITPTFGCNEFLKYKKEKRK